MSVSFQEFIVHLVGAGEPFAPRAVNPATCFVEKNNKLLLARARQE